MTFKPEHFTVWAEIPTTDIKRAVRFYNRVFNLDMTIDETTGPNPMAVFPTSSKNGIAGHIYPGQPAEPGCGPTVHFAAPDTLEDALERVKTAGGEVLSAPIQIPAGRFAYCRDPDGNSVGLFSV